MSGRYRQFCPVAKAAEILAERWMPVVVRELLYGSRRWSDYQHGIPTISPGVLRQRLNELVEAGIAVRRGTTYVPTESGEALRPIIEAMGHWGQRWVQRTVAESDSDPRLLVWAAHRYLRLGALPAKATIALEFPNEPASRRYFWLVVRDGNVEVCLSHPGLPVDVTIIADAREFARLYLGHVDCGAVLASRGIAVQGNPALVRSFRHWFPRSGFATTQPSTTRPRAMRVESLPHGRRKRPVGISARGAASS